MKIPNEEIEALSKRRLQMKTEPSFVLIDSGMCRMPIVSDRKIREFPKNEDLDMDEDYMPDLYNYPLYDDSDVPLKNRQEGRTINMRVDIKRRVRGNGIVAPPTSPTTTRAMEPMHKGTTAPPPTPATSMVDMGANLSQCTDIRDEISEDDDVELHHKESRVYSRHQSAPPMMSQYRTRILSSTSPWIKKRAVLAPKSSSNFEAVLVERPMSSVRPFSERETNSKSNSNLSQIRILPPNPSRVPMPDFGSFRGKPSVRVTMRTFSRQRQLSNNSNKESFEKSNFDADLNPVEMPSRSGSKIDQYVSELRKTMKSGSIDKKKVKPYSQWALSSTSDMKSEISDLESLGRSSEENFMNPNSNSLIRISSISETQTGHNQSQLKEPNSVKNEVIRQIQEAHPGEGLAKNFLEVKGDCPPRNIRTSYVGFEPENGEAPGGANRDFPSGRTNLYTSAKRGTMRYTRQLSGKNVTGEDVRNVTCYHNNNLRKIRLPSYVEFKVINRSHIYEQTLPLLKLKIHPPRVLNVTTGSDIITRHNGKPFSRSFIGKSAQ